MRAPLVGVVGLLFLVSGCVTETDGTAKDDDPVENTGELKLRPIVDPETPETRSTQAPPKWRQGEWWTYELTDAFTGQTYRFTRVVAGIEGDNYLVAMPSGEFVNAIMVMHVPGFGEVKQSDLSFEIHDFPFEPLKFPLTKGAKWPSKFEGPDIEVEVLSVSETEAEIGVTGAFEMKATYDAELGDLSSLDIVGYASYKVVDHGVGYDGLVTVPHMHDIAFIHFRLGQVFGSGGTNVPVANLPFQPSPSDTVPVDTTYDRVSFAFIMGSAVPDPSAPQGYYSLTATAPDGYTYNKVVTPADPPGLKIWFFGHDNPGGDWKFDHVAAGPGITLAEGIAYHVYDVELPSGKVLPSTGEHDHGG